MQEHKLRTNNNIVLVLKENVWKQIGFQPWMSQDCSIANTEKSAFVQIFLEQTDLFYQVILFSWSWAHDFIHLNAKVVLTMSHKVSLINTHAYISLLACSGWTHTSSSSKLNITAISKIDSDVVRQKWLIKCKRGIASFVSVCVCGW